MIRLAALLCCLAGLALATPAKADDRHAGYYYPQPQSIETYHARATPLPEANRARRLGFISGVTQSQLNSPYPVQHVMFAKGQEAEKLVIVALRDGYLDTIYRARALFAGLTSAARVTPIFADLDEFDRYTFFDLAVLLGFTRITVSDGETFAHQVELSY